MQAPLQISMHNVARSEALETRIRELATRLESFHPRLTSCRVAVEQSGKHHRQGTQFSVTVEVRAPAHEQAVATLHHDEDVYVALRDAFDAARRQLEDLVRRARP